jgi:hypothetical protein
MRKDTTRAKITKVEIKRNCKIAKKRYIRFQPVVLPGRRVEQYFGLSHLHHGFQLVERTARRENTVGGHGDDEEYLGCDVQTDGAQPISYFVDQY